MAAIGALVVGISIGSGGGGSDEGGGGESSSAGPQLPGGGTRVLPDHRVVAFYGHPRDPELGVLGIGSPREAGARLAQQAADYDRFDRPVMPAFELIATLATADPGAEGEYNLRLSRDEIRRYLAAVRSRDGLLILDIQPGIGGFMEEVRALEPFLSEPDVGLALDPEWNLQEGELPGSTLGSVDAAEVNEVADYLSGIVERGNLPQKLLVVHQFTDGMVENREELEFHPGVALVLNVDGFGDRPNKVAKYRGLRPQTDGLGSFAHSGFKLFYREDAGLIRPRGVVRLRPSPEFVVYE